jgi:hypothetical protein
VPTVFPSFDFSVLEMKGLLFLSLIVFCLLWFRDEGQQTMGKIYKAREGLVSLPPQMVGIVEARDHDRIVGIVAMICWIFPC